VLKWVALPAAEGALPLPSLSTSRNQTTQATGGPRHTPHHGGSGPSGRCRCAPAARARASVRDTTERACMLELHRASGEMRLAVVELQAAEKLGGRSRQPIWNESLLYSLFILVFWLSAQEALAGALKPRGALRCCGAVQGRAAGRARPHGERPRHAVHGVPGERTGSCVQLPRSPAGLLQGLAHLQLQLRGRAASCPTATPRPCSARWPRRRCPDPDGSRPTGEGRLPARFLFRIAENTRTQAQPCASPVLKDLDEPSRPGWADMPTVGLGLLLTWQSDA